MQNGRDRDITTGQSLASARFSEGTDPDDVTGSEQVDDVSQGCVTCDKERFAFARRQPIASLLGR